jgi:hypothetical protein
MMPHIKLCFLSQELESAYGSSASARRLPFPEKLKGSALAFSSIHHLSDTDPLGSNFVVPTQSGLPDLGQQGSTAAFQNPHRYRFRQFASAPLLAAYGYRVQRPRSPRISLRHCHWRFGQGARAGLPTR